jgi:hypothetical protein
MPEIIIKRRRQLPYLDFKVLVDKEFLNEKLIKKIYVTFKRNKPYAYIYLTEYKKSIPLSRFVLGLLNFNGDYVDHIDGDPLNNQVSNLRILSNSNNIRNQKVIRNKLGVKGVSYRKGLTRPYIAKICINKISNHLGYFKTKIAASKAYTKAYKKIMGE